MTVHGRAAFFSLNAINPDAVKRSDLDSDKAHVGYLLKSQRWAIYWQSKIEEFECLALLFCDT